MKNVSIEIRNAGLSIKFDLEVSASKSLEKVQRALVYRFFDYYDTMKRIGAKGFKATEPMQIALKIDGAKKWDSVTFSVEAQARLKLNNTPKSRGKFEYNLGELVALSLRMNETNEDKIVKQLTERLMAS